MTGETGRAARGERPELDAGRVVDLLYGVSALLDVAEARLKKANARVMSLMVDFADGTVVGFGEDGGE